MASGVVTDWARREMANQGLTTEENPDPFAWSGFFCLASGCVEDLTDSYGECIHCGEPVVRVYEVVEAG